MNVLKRLFCLIFLCCIFSAYGFSQSSEMRVTVEISNIAVNGGKIYLTVCSSAENFKNEIPDFEYVLEPDNAVKFKELSLKNGEYVISAYQDANNNGKLDYGLFGAPKELVGISNYFGKGYPSKSFDKQKVSVNESIGRVVIGLYKF